MSSWPESPKDRDEQKKMFAKKLRMTYKHTHTHIHTKPEKGVNGVDRLQIGLFKNFDFKGLCTKSEIWRHYRINTKPVIQISEGKSKG